MNDLLIKAIKKQQELYKDYRWNKELLPYAPPVLWFGDVESSLLKIVTIGANPSRREFLENASENPDIRKNYFKGGLPRFYVLNEPFYTTKEFPPIVLSEIINSYNKYFETNPYKTWFGKPDDGGKVEAMLKGLDCSFYDDIFSYRGIHLDLFPFATLSDFKKIESLCDDTLFVTGWAQKFLMELIGRINPALIIVFGRSNYVKFLEIFTLPEVNSVQLPVKRRSRQIYFNNFNIGALNIPLVGLSVNLGNPAGWSGEELVWLGEFITKNLK